MNAKSRTPEKAEKPEKPAPRRCHVYVVLLRKPDGTVGFYVGQSAVPPEERFAQHMAGYKASGHVRRWGVHLLPELYERLNPMTRLEAEAMEREIAERLRRQGCWVEGGH